MNIDKWLKKNTNDLNGKVIAISGASGDLGRETCKILVSLGANLIFLNRNEDKTNNLKEELYSLNDKVNIDFIKIDFENFNSVVEGTNKLKEYDIDVLIINAAAYKIKRRISDIGYDNVFQINFVSPFYMIKEIFKEMKIK